MSSSALNLDTPEFRMYAPEASRRGARRSLAAKLMSMDLLGSDGRSGAALAGFSGALLNVY